MRKGVYPGSFNPPTTAHLAIAEAALSQHRLDLVVLSVSRQALAKESVDRPLFEHRIEVLEEVASSRSWLQVQTTDRQLLADVAHGFAVVIVGADKWAQIHELRWYDGSNAKRDKALAELPTVAIAPRDEIDVPTDSLLVLAGQTLADVSSTAARGGQLQMMLAEARTFAEKTGAWIDAAKYEDWIIGQR